MPDICGCSKSDCKAWLCVNISCLIIGFPIWAGLYFTAYEPYLNRDWSDSNCTIIDIQTYITLHTSWQVYIQYKALLEIDGKTYPGYGCESTASKLRPDDYSVDDSYPYSYVECEKYHRGGDQCPEELIFLPKWLCMPYEGAPAFSIGEVVNCKWWLRSMHAEPEEVEKLSYPTYDGDFIELMFQDEMYIPINDYNALWVIPFGLMSMIPFIILMFWVIPSLKGYCDEESFDRLKDIFDIYIKCKKVIPRNVRRLPAPYLNNKGESCTPWLYAYEHSISKKRKINDAMLREICEYISGPYINPNSQNN
jgi:hypothetical protein